MLLNEREIKLGVCYIFNARYRSIETVRRLPRESLGWKRQDTISRLVNVFATFIRRKSGTVTGLDDERKTERQLHRGWGSHS